MFIKYFIIIIGILCSANLFAQNAKEDSLKSAIALYREQKFPEAYNLFQKTFQVKDTGKTDADNYFYAAACATKCYQYDTAFNWLYKYADSTDFPQTVNARILTDFDDIHSDHRWEKFINYLHSKEDNYARSKHYDLTIKKELDQMWYDDQYLRYRINVYEKKYSDTSKEMNDLWNRINYFDSVNLVKLKNILGKYGWISKKQVGNSSYSQWMIIQHSDTATIDKYLPLLKKEADSGEISKSSLALTLDRANLYNGKKQIYGSQVSDTVQTLHRPAYIQPLEDPDNVDKRRKEMGLEPIAEYAKQFGMIWNVEEYKKMLPTYEKWQWGEKGNK